MKAMLSLFTVVAVAVTGAPGQSGPPRSPTTEVPRSGGPAPAPAKVKDLAVDAGRAAGTICSLLGVNRGPFSYARRPGEQTVDLVDSYRRLGIDFIRTHDFYGPTDWQVMFPDWPADAEAAASYDFAASDERISGIVDHGFGCFFRLGTSWKGNNLRPINDPPGTLRDAKGRVTHVATREDFRKWARICVQVVRHYTEGWSEGFRHPIEYWEIWNEPDLAAQFWTGTPEQYYQLYEEAAKALKQYNPKLKVGGPACTGGLREAYVEGFLRHCREHQVPLDFFSWHSYGGRNEFNPRQFYRDAQRIRGALAAQGFTRAENILTEWNAGIQQRLFSDTPRGAAFYASTFVNLLDAGVGKAFQYCGDQHPGLGLHERGTAEPKICAGAFVAWKRLLETPQRLAATGTDERGYALVAGKSGDGRRVRVLVSDFQSDRDGFDLRLRNLPWAAGTSVALTCWRLDGDGGLRVVEERTEAGNDLRLQRPFRAGSVALIELEAKAGP